jgi:O-antigen/teichoic acid export membrane protein
VLIALLTVVPEQVLQYCLDTLRLHFAPGKFAVVSLLKNLLGVVIGLVLILKFGLGLEGLFLGGLIGATAAVPLALAMIRKDLTSSAFDFPTVRRLAIFGYPFIFGGLAYWVFSSADRWMLAELSTAAQVGLYAVAFKFATIILFLNAAFGQAWSPAAMKIRRDLPEYREVYARVLSVWYFLLVLVGTGVALFAAEVLRLLTPAEYWDAAPALAVLVMGAVLSGTTQITAIGISLEKKTKLFAVAAWVTAVVNVVANLVLIPRWGALGAAAATFLSYGLLTALYLGWSQKLHPIPLEKRNLGYCVGLTLAVVALSGSSLLLEASILAVLAKLALLALIAMGAFALGILDVRSLRGAILARGRS